MADISRNSFDETKNYDKVILQQGKPLTDYDFNEAQDIQRVKMQRVVSELFGDGAIGDGYRIYLDGSVLRVAAGVAYVKGYRVTNPTAIAVPSVPTTNGTYRVYINLTEQEVDSVMDPAIKHSKLPMEPTRRVKITASVQVGLSVPADTSTNKYLYLADITVASTNVTSVTDKRVVKEQTTGTGFVIRSSATIGSRDTDVIDLRGRIKNLSDNFGGVVYVDSAMEVTGNLKVAGGIELSGPVREAGKQNLIGDVVLFGLAGDLQYENNPSTWDDVGSLMYGLFVTGTNGTFPAVSAGASRQYRIRVAYSDLFTSAEDIFIQLRLFNDNTQAEIIKWNLPVVTGQINGERKYIYLPNFQANISSNVRLQVRLSNSQGTTVTTSKHISILNVRLLAYDVYP